MTAILLVTFQLLGNKEATFSGRVELIEGNIVVTVPFSTSGEVVFDRLCEQAKSAIVQIIT